MLGVGARRGPTQKPGCVKSGSTTIMETRMRTGITHTVSAPLVRNCPIVLSALSGDASHGATVIKKRCLFETRNTNAPCALRCPPPPLPEVPDIARAMSSISTYLGSQVRQSNSKPDNTSLVKPRPPAKEFGCLDRSNTMLKNRHTI